MGSKPAKRGEDKEIGKVTPATDGAEAAGDTEVLRVESRSQATNRWRREGIDETVAAFRDRVREEYRAAHPDRPKREAHDHAWTRAIAEFPPPGVDAAIVPDPDPQPEAPAIPPTDPEPAESEGLVGLAEIPAGWPDLPPNAALQDEVSWVQSNRLRVRQGDTVDLSRALSPAPSHAALAWLETSILYGSKWADITAKATQHQEDGREASRRESVAIEEVQGLLAEMIEVQQDTT